MTNPLISRRIIQLQCFGFVVIILLQWLNEILDIPHWLIGAEPTPINYRENILETGWILLLLALICYSTWLLLKRIQTLEKFLFICANCKKIRRPGTDPYVQNSWENIEVYLQQNAGSDFSHGLCPQCAKKLYPDLDFPRETGKPE